MHPLAIAIAVAFAGAEATVDAPAGIDSLCVVRQGAHVTIEAASTDTLEVALTGASPAGGLTLRGAAAARFSLTDLTLANDSAGPVAVVSPIPVEVEINGFNSLTDSAQRDSIHADSHRACLTAGADLTLTGSGTLRLTANYKHGVYAARRLSISGPTINIVSAKTDGLRGKKKVTLTGSTVTATKTNKHAINSDDASVVIDSCTIDITLKKNNAKGIAATKALTIANSTLRFNLAANASKALKSDASITLTNVDLEATATGGLDIDGADKTYCSIIKSDANLTLTDVAARITHHGEGAKGFTCDSLMTLSRSTIDMLLTGNGAPYLPGDDADQLDFFTPRCLESKGCMTIDSGCYTLHASGTGGKGIVCDSLLTVGAPGAPDDLLLIDIVTEGTAVVNDIVDDRRFGCPKAIKCGRLFTLNSGTIRAQTCGMGGEGIESKGELTINGGTIVAHAFDDGINVGEGLTINAGTLLCTSTDNDGIDSNGFIRLNGGTVVSLTSHQYDEDFDCDDARFYLDGGTILGVGRDFSGIYEVGQPYAQHVAYVRDRAKNLYDTISAVTATAGCYLTLTGADRRPVVTAAVHADIPALFATMSSPEFCSGSDLCLFQTDLPPAGARALIADEVYTGGDPLTHEPLLTAVAGLAPYVDNQPVDLTLDLHRGWNLVSPPVIGGLDPESLGPSARRIEYADTLLAVRNPQTGRLEGNLTRLDSCRAYLVFMDADTTLSIDGMSMPPIARRPFAPGVNRIGTGLPEAVDIADAFPPHLLREGDYLADRHSFAVYLHGRWTGPLTRLLPTSGYYLIRPPGN